MLYSKSVLLMPEPKCESWLMEGKLEPFVHYLPLTRERSNIKDVVGWAKEIIEKTRAMSERSMLFINDLFLHPDAISDEKMVMEKIVKKKHYLVRMLR